MINYLENSNPGNLVMNPMLQRSFFGASNKLSVDQLIPALFGSHTPIPVVPYKTTVTPFGPILPTSFSLTPPDVGNSAGRPVSSYVLQPPKPEPWAPSAAPVPRMEPGPPVISQRQAAEDLLRRILSPDSSSSEGEEERPKSIQIESQNSTRRHSKVGEFKQQATAVHSPVIASSVPAPVLSPPARIASLRTPRTDRMRKKQEELEKVQQFLEESKAVHEKIYASFDVRKVSSRAAPATVPASSSTHRRSLSNAVSEANNVAELRRNIAVSNKREVSPLPPRAPSNQRTPSASSQSPRPASPDRIVSGVFVSYPRKAKRSISAPPEEPSASDPPVVETNVISSMRPQGAGKLAKMTAEEYAEFRRNLLNRSEQHAVTSTGSSLQG